MADLTQLANEIEVAARDARAIAKGLRDTADVCSPEQAALKTRLQVASIALTLQRDAMDNAVATLRGIREMARVEAEAGSNAWRKAIVLIDQSLRELQA